MNATERPTRRRLKPTMRRAWQRRLCPVVAALLVASAGVPTPTWAQATPPATTSPATTDVLPPIPVWRPLPTSRLLPPSEALNAINIYFNSVISLQGQFIQTQEDGTIIDGTFLLARPGYFRFEYNPPSGLLVISNGVDVVIIDNVAHTRSSIPLERTPLRYLLSEELDLTTSDLIRDVIVHDDIITIVMVENRLLMDGYLTLVFDRRTLQLRAWQVTEPIAGTTTVEIYNTLSNQRMSVDMFQLPTGE